ncbi:hypothetical protein P879_03777 [Paragonimus westermani]|uniref:Protein-S-isoprenylcysteine O-methyltransferase n=1 Tax=Paragonimus westermani TaxID=34504 RepID=A0A8T0DN72_9TREM|nr:hypothetical protein P879_03777 [Paragonimus westermani]
MVTTSSNSSLFIVFKQSSDAIISLIGFLAEFYFTAVYNPTYCSIDIYMITHSTEYVFAAAASVVEYLFRMFLLPSWCCIPLLVHFVGFFMCIGGEVLRKMAIITAANNFNHYIELARRPDHTLVTHGIYSWFRHPAYVGWFYWALGTQLLLGNPLCFVAYAVAAHKFFRDRIEYEEKQLIYFFRQDYCEYQKRVGVGIPFIQGYKPRTAERS